MGMLAQYMMIDKATLDALFTLKNGKALSQKLFELEETGKYETYGIGKTWDALHFVLTGTSASEPIWDNKLSEAIVGIHLFNYYKSDDDYITVSENVELSDIITAIEEIDLEEVFQSFDFTNSELVKIYPNGIFDTPIQDLKIELTNALQGILEFYKKALKNDKHLLISIL